MFQPNLSRVLFRHALKTTIAILLLSAVTLAWGRTSLLAGDPAAPPSAQAPVARSFGSDAGMMLNTIKADKTEDFEAVVAKLKEALMKSANPMRRQQAASWRVFRALEPGVNNSVLYVFWVDPPAKDADYTVSKILAEEFPADAQQLYKKFSDAYAGGQTLINLRLVSRMGE
jgi:hypothetical protein